VPASVCPQMSTDRSAHRAAIYRPQRGPPAEADGTSDHRGAQGLASLGLEVGGPPPLPSMRARRLNLRIGDGKGVAATMGQCGSPRGGPHRRWFAVRLSARDETRAMAQGPFPPRTVRGDSGRVSSPSASRRGLRRGAYAPRLSTRTAREVKTLKRTAEVPSHLLTSFHFTSLIYPPTMFGHSSRWHMRCAKK